MIQISEIINEYQNKILNPGYTPLTPIDTLKSRLTAVYLLQSDNKNIVKKAEDFIRETSTRKEDDLIRLRGLSKRVVAWNSLTINHEYGSHQDQFLDYTLSVTTEQGEEVIHQEALYKKGTNDCLFICQSSAINTEIKRMLILLSEVDHLLEQLDDKQIIKLLHLEKPLIKDSSYDQLYQFMKSPINTERKIYTAIIAMESLLGQRLVYRSLFTRLQIVDFFITPMPIEECRQLLKVRENESMQKANQSSHVSTLTEYLEILFEEPMHGAEHLRTYLLAKEKQQSLDTVRQAHIKKWWSTLILPRELTEERFDLQWLCITILLKESQNIDTILIEHTDFFMNKRISTKQMREFNQLCQNHPSLNFIIQAAAIQSLTLQEWQGLKPCLMNARSVHLYGYNSNNNLDSMKDDLFDDLMNSLSSSKIESLKFNHCNLDAINITKKISFLDLLSQGKFAELTIINADFSQPLDWSAIFDALEKNTHIKQLSIDMRSNSENKQKQKWFDSFQKMLITTKIHTLDLSQIELESYFDSLLKVLLNTSVSILKVTEPPNDYPHDEFYNKLFKNYPEMISQLEPVLNKNRKKQLLDNPDIDRPLTRLIARQCFFQQSSKTPDLKELQELIEEEKKSTGVELVSITDFL